MDLRRVIAVIQPNTNSRYVFDINDIKFICERKPIDDSEYRECEIGLKSGRVIRCKEEVYEKLYHLFMDDEDDCE